MKKNTIVIIILIVVVAAAVWAGYYLTQTKEGLIQRFIWKWCPNATAAQKQGVREEMAPLTIEQVKQYLISGPG